MNQRLIGLFLSACLCAGLSGCGKADVDTGIGIVQQSSAVKELGSDIAASTNPAPVDSYEELKNGVNRFAFALYDALPKDSNCFYSPYSICSALSMLDQVPEVTQKRNCKQRLVSRIFLSGITKCKAI